MPHIFDTEAVCQQCGRAFMTERYRAERGTAKFCSKVCQGLSKRQNLEIYFWASVRKTRGCWIWEGTLNTNGYGRFASGRVIHYAHRVGYELANGPIPKGLDVCHKCDNPRCVRPTHLFLGTQKENTQDRDSKGRVSHGDDHVKSKLNTQDVIAIRASVAAGKATYRALARQHGVSYGAINDIINRRTWKHVP